MIFSSLLFGSIWWWSTEGVDLAIQGAEFLLTGEFE